MGAVVLDQGVKPAQWGFDPGFVAPEWDWFRRGLFLALPLWDNGGLPQDIAIRQPLISNTGVWTAGNLGPALNFNGSSQYLNAGVRNSYLQTKLISAWVRFRADSNDSMALAHFEMSADHDLQIYVTTTPSIFCRIGSGLSVTVPYSLGETVDIHLTYNRFTLDLHAYKNGILIGSDNGGAVFSNNNEPWLIGTDPDATGISNLGNYFGGDIEGVALWDRILSANEIKQHAHDPFGPFRMEDEAAFFVPAAGGITLSIFDKHYRQMRAQ